MASERWPERSVLIEAVDAAQADKLRAWGSKAKIVFPDSDSRNAFGRNLMDLSTRQPAARAGYNQGKDLAEQLTEFWC